MIGFLKNPVERNRFLKFCTVGIIGAVVDFGVMNLCMRLFAMPSRAASTVSFIAAVLSNFLWNHFWAYPDSREKPIVQKLVQFTLVSVVGLGIRYLLFLTIEAPILNLSAATVPVGFPLDAETIGHNLTLVISIVIVLIWNFLANRFWTYNDVK